MVDKFEIFTVEYLEYQKEHQLNETECVMYIY